MRNYHLNRNTKWCKAINLDKVWSLLSEQARERCKDLKDGKAPVIDVVKAVSTLMYPIIMISQITAGLLFYTLAELYKNLLGLGLAVDAISQLRVTTTFNEFGVSSWRLAYTSALPMCRIYLSSHCFATSQRWDNRQGANCLQKYF